MTKLSDTEKWGLLGGTASQGAPAPSDDLGVSYMSEVVGQLSSDGAAELLRGLPKEFADRVLASLPAAKSAELSDILSCPPGTAGSMMCKEYLHAPAEMTCADAIAYLHLMPAGRKGKTPYVYLTDREGRLVGQVQTQDLVLNELDTVLETVMQTMIVTVQRQTPSEEIVKTLENTRLAALPVVDSDGRPVGVIPAHNALSAVKEQADRDIAKIVGTDAEEMRTHSVPKIMRLRLPWLFVNIASGLTCAFITGIFERQLHEVMALFLFIPVVLGLSESTGIQGATIVVRNLTLGRLRAKDIGGLFAREVAVGLLIGLVCAAVVGSVTFVWQGNPLLGVAVGLSLNVAIVVSAIIGLSLPLVFKALRIDPAIASGPLVLAICDIQTLFVYFFMSGWVLGA
ncbi:MAG: Magnesium transporter MgtE [Candidatus Omnitrophica bacterium]|nr:Magnesium transporter MgtE [Candidatus Omnitrophota bacterium]